MRNLGGRLHIKDGVLVLEEMGFISRAAKMQLTGIYRTPRRNHLYLGLDFHMTNIQIEELIKMVPEIDTILPMITSFKGKAEFHFAASAWQPSSRRKAFLRSPSDQPPSQHSLHWYPQSPQSFQVLL